jgi:type I restriction enzyme S subunit
MADALEQSVPEGWARARLADVTLKVPNVKPAEEPERLFRYVDISSIDNESYKIADTKEFAGRDAPSRAKRPICAGDVLFSNVRTYLKNVAVVPDELDGQVASTGFTVLRPNGAVLTQYLYRWVLGDEFVDTVTPQQTGSSYPATTDRVVRDQLLPLPPLPEQKRIVAKVEALLSRVWSVRKRLAAVPDILK